jgi:hypothetical protein
MRPKLDVGDTLREVFGIYREHAGVLLPVAFWLFLVVAILNALAVENLALAPVELVVSTIVTTLYQGMVVGLVHDLRDGRRDSSVGNLTGYALPVLGPLIGASILAALGIGVGFLLLILPGLYLFTIWALIAPAIVIERRGAFASFGRSRELVRGNGWPVFWALIAAILIALIPAAILTGIAESVIEGPIVQVVFLALGLTVTAPVMGLVTAVIYFRLLEAQANQPSPEALAAPDPPAPPA